MTAHDHGDDNATGPAPGHTDVQYYEITVRGHLGAHWAVWFDGLDLTCTNDGNTVIRGPVVDQAALHGLLAKLRDLGIPLVSLTTAPTPERP